MKRSIILLGALVALASASNRTSPIAVGINAFAFDFYNQVAEDIDGNIFFSPHSISTAFSMAYAGTQGTTESEIAEVMHYGENTPEFHAQFGAFNRLLEQNAKGNIELNIANRIWREKTYTFQQDYLDLVEEAYEAPIKEADFRGNPDGERTGINNWVADKTNDKILDLLPPGSITTDSRMVLANAIYFKGDWKHKFDKKKTKSKSFNLIDGETKKVDFMEYEGGLPYSNRGGYHMVRLPYKGDAQSMVVVLPNGPDDILTVERAVGPHIFEPLFYSGQPKVHLELPKFKMTLPLSLNGYLNEMGMENPFQPGANFSRMTPSNDLYISSAVHKAFIEIDETGTEAAAATAIVMTTESISMNREPEVINFIANEPFLFYIIDNQTKAILFMGRVMEP